MNSVVKLEYRNVFKKKHPIDFFIIYLHASSQYFMKHVSSILHDPDVFRGGVGTLAVLYGVDEAVSKFVQRAQQVPLDEAHHAVIYRDKTKHDLTAFWFINDLSYCFGSLMTFHIVLVH